VAYSNHCAVAIEQILLNSNVLRQHAHCQVISTSYPVTLS